MSRKNRLFAKLASTVNNSGKLQASSLAADIDVGGVEGYADTNALPANPSLGDLALVTSTNTLYVYNGSAWFNIAIANQAPTAITGNEASYALASDGTPTVVTLVSTDPDGFPLTWSATTSGDTQVGTVANTDNVFTITPSTSESDIGTLSVTFSVTDGNNAETTISTFTLAFTSPYWDDTVLSIGTSSTNGLNNSTFIDRSTNAHTLTLTGTPVQTAFHPYLDNWSVQFDGTGDYLTTSIDASLELGSSDYTLEAWIYLTATPGNGDAIFSKGTVGSTTNNFYSLEFSVTPTLKYFVYEAGINAPVLESPTLSLHTWYHVAVIRNGSNQIMFINGQSVDTATVSYTMNSGGNIFSVGRGWYSTDREFNGYIADARIIKGTAVYTSAFTPPTGKLTAVPGTSLLTCQSNRFIDNSTNAHAITVNGDPAISAFNPFGQESEYAADENKGSVYLNGGSYMDIADPTNEYHLSGEQFTIEFWVNRRADTEGKSIISKWNAAYNGYRINMDNSGILGFYNKTTSYPVTTSAPTDAWTHYAVTRDSQGIVRQFINGDLERVDGFNVDNASGTQSFRIGSLHLFADQGELKGYLSDFRLIKGTALYTSSFTPPTSPVGNTNADIYLPFDNAGIFDKTGNNSLTLNGNVATSTTQTKYADTAIYFGGVAQTDYIRSNKLFGEYFSAAATEIFTIEAWINLEQNNAYPTFQWHNAAIFAIEPSYLVFGVDVNNKIVFYHNDGSQRNWTPGSNTINLNTWHHVAVCSDGAGGLKTFVDGIQDATGTYYGIRSASSTATMDLGASGFQNSNERAFQGYIENFQLLKGVAKYTTDFTPPSRTQGKES